MARYRKIDPRIWFDERFTAFDPFEKLVWFSFLTHPLMTPMGVGVIAPSFIDDVLGNDRTFCFRCQDLCGKPEHFAHTYMDTYIKEGMIYRDTHLIIVKNYLVYNRPDNPKQLLSWLGSVEELPRSEKFAELRDHLFKTLAGQPEWLFKGLLDPLAAQQNRTLSEKFWERVGLTESVEPSVNKTSHIGMPIPIAKKRDTVPKKTGYQEQEQEQEQEQGIVLSEPDKPDSDHPTSSIDPDIVIMLHRCPKLSILNHGNCKVFWDGIIASVETYKLGAEWLNKELIGLNAWMVTKNKGATTIQGAQRRVGFWIRRALDRVEETR